mmetsp:Transcript_5886/g.14658  ORF Transcript_5886/g.14658 Transcript_5886/m.14658 type:complete len:275 (+) Transcript_5886:694-1518(+)
MLWICLSSSGSSADVASSSSRIPLKAFSLLILFPFPFPPPTSLVFALPVPPFGFRRIALARARSWRSPCEKLPPPSLTSASKFVPSLSCSRANLNASTISASVDSRKGSRLNRIDPLKITGSCGITIRFFRSWCSPNSPTSRPSIFCVPEQGSTIRIRDSSRLLFPLPVRPQIPRLVPAGTDKDTFFSTSGSSSRYRSDTSANSTRPLVGLQGELLQEVPSRSASVGICSTYCFSRSTEIIWVSRSADSRFSAFSVSVSFSEYMIASPTIPAAR